MAAVWVDLVSLSCWGSLGMSWWKDPVHSPPGPLATPHAGTAYSSVSPFPALTGTRASWALLCGLSVRPQLPVHLHDSPLSRAVGVGAPALSGLTWRFLLASSPQGPLRSACLPPRKHLLVFDSEFGEASISLAWGRSVRGQGVSIRGFHGLGIWV